MSEVCECFDVFVCVWPLCVQFVVCGFVSLSECLFVRASVVMFAIVLLCVAPYTLHPTPYTLHLKADASGDLKPSCLAPSS